METELLVDGETRRVSELQHLLETFCEPNKEFLKEFGRKHGFLNIQLRYQAYSLLLGISEEEVMEAGEALNSVELKDPNETIRQDCNRSYGFFEKSVKLGKKENLAPKREELEKVLHSFFQSHRQFSYYQGINFIAELFCMTYGKNIGYVLFEKFIDGYFSKFMHDADSFVKEISKTLKLTLHVLKGECPNILRILSKEQHQQQDVMTGMGFLISMVITWCASRIKNEDKLFQVYDFMLCTDSDHKTSYFLASVVLELMAAKGITVETSDEEVKQILYHEDLGNLDLSKVFKRTLALMAKPDYDAKRFFNDKTKFDEFTDLLEKPVKMFTNEKFTKLENLGILMAAGAGLLGLLFLGLAKLKK